MPIAALSSTSVLFGGCVIQGGATAVTQCQIDADFCAPGGFRTGREVLPTCGAEDVRTTKCAGSSALGLCTPGGCGSGTAEDDANCNLLKHDRNKLLTVYGACQERYTKTLTGCFYRPEDCDDSNGDGVADAVAAEEYLTPDALFAILAQPEVHGVTFSDKLYCDCGDVRTGACAEESVTFDEFGNKNTTFIYSYCAVDEDSCDDGEVFYNARQVLQTPSMRQCTLCDPSDITAAVRTETQIFFDVSRTNLLDQAAMSSSSSSSSGSGDDVGSSTSSTSPSKDNDNRIVIGIVAGSIVGVALLVLLVWLLPRVCCGGGGGGTKREDSDPTEMPAQDGSESSLPIDGREIA